MVEKKFECLNVYYGWMFQRFVKIYSIHVCLYNLCAANIATVIN